MVLKKQYVEIQQVVFSDTSFVQDHVLHICKEELERLAADELFSKVVVDIAEPGTECRLMNIADVVQPSVRLGAEDTTFPGVAGRIATVGSGTSLQLRNVLVSEIMELPVTIGCFLDMSGPATEYSELSKFYHVTLDAFPVEGVNLAEYQHALHRASKVVACYLAKLAVNESVDDTVEYSLRRDHLEGLPKVAYLAGVFCQSYMSDTTVYGESLESSMPVLLHPNEILDGAVTDRNYGTLLNADPTYVWQNHPVIEELYRRHGVDLNFVGVVISNTPHAVEWKKRNALMSASCIHYQLEADCCLITKEGGGNTQVDVAMALDELEFTYGIRCVLILTEFLSLNNASREQVLFSSSAADAMISTGCVMPVEVPACARVIGSTPISPAPGFTKGEIVPQESFIHRNRAIRGAISQLGWSWHSSIKF